MGGRARGRAARPRGPRGGARSGQLRHTPGRELQPILSQVHAIQPWTRAVRGAEQGELRAPQHRQTRRAPRLGHRAASPIRSRWPEMRLASRFQALRAGITGACRGVAQFLHDIERSRIRVERTIDGLPQSLRRAGATCEWQAEPSGSWDSMGRAGLEVDAGRREEARERRSVRHARGS